MPAGARASSSTSLRLFSTWSLTSSRLLSSLGLDFPSTFLIFDVSRAQLSLEKVDDFSGFPEGKL